MLFSVRCLQQQLIFFVHSIIISGLSEMSEGDTVHPIAMINEITDELNNIMFRYQDLSVCEGMPNIKLPHITEPIMTVYVR